MISTRYNTCLLDFDWYSIGFKWVLVRCQLAIAGISIRVRLLFHAFEFDFNYFSLGPDSNSIGFNSILIPFSISFRWNLNLIPVNSQWIRIRFQLTFHWFLIGFQFVLIRF